MSVLIRWMCDVYPTSAFRTISFHLSPFLILWTAAARGYASGGMVTKLQAAKIALAGGCHMVISDGRRRHPLRAIAEGARCTWFVASAAPQSARKQWIAGSLKPLGVLGVDDGAWRALQNGRSLLPVGVLRVTGRFERGDLVMIRAGDGRELGRGLCAYSSDDAEAMATWLEENDYDLTDRGAELIAPYVEEGMNFVAHVRGQTQSILIYTLASLQSK